MSELKPVSRPSFLLDGRGGLIIGVIVVAVGLAFFKPWGSDSAPTRGDRTGLAATPSPSPSPSPTPDPLDTISRKYDPLIFGDRELQPDWGLWPAGYLTTFGFAMRAEPSSQPQPAGASPALPSAVASSRDLPIWPNVIDVVLGNHLLLMGISTPTDYSVDSVHITRERADGTWEEVPILLLPPPWPRHFKVVGIDGGFGPARPIFWVPGHYQLDVIIDPGQIERSIKIDVEGPTGETPSAAPTGVPSAAEPSTDSTGSARP
jgi:hypothetical protein